MLAGIWSSLNNALPQPVAILFQSAPAPPVDGVHKPMKEGGYSDSGADIAFSLRSCGIDVVTPVPSPDPAEPLHWVWPDTPAGIDAAIARNASVLWANTVLYTGHPLSGVPGSVRIVGHPPERSEPVEDKFCTNALLLAAGLPVTRSSILAVRAESPGEIALRDLTPARLAALGFLFPLVVKPIRGRGSQGVSVVSNFPDLQAAARALFAAEDENGPLFGPRLMLEEFLPGEEITVAVLPPGTYRVNGQESVRRGLWALPPVRRTNHHEGIAPYSGVVAVSANSAVMSAAEIALPHVQAAMHACEGAAGRLGAAAVMRIDCRLSAAGEYKLFDANMKPNMTGPGRPGRGGQDSLVSMAARAIGWSYPDLLINLLAQAWPAGSPPLSDLREPLGS